VAVAGGIAVGYKLHLDAASTGLSRYLKKGQATLSPYIIISKQGIVIITPRAEMGQGIHTTLAYLVAEELDIPVSLVKVEHGPTSNLYSNYTMFPNRTTTNWKKKLKNAVEKDPWRESRQLTGGQTSTRDAFVIMRKAGAAARQVLIEAAARRWKVDKSSLATSDGSVINPQNGDKLSYLELADKVSTIKLPEDPPLKPRADWKYLGKSQKRVDLVDKCRGTATYAIDITRPDMLFGVVRLNPHIGSRMIDYNDTQASRMPGVRKVIPLENGIIVVASNTWYAMQATKTVTIDWEKANYPDTTEGHRESINEAFNTPPNTQPRNDGDVDQTMQGAVSIEGEYQVPYLAHANMEPLNALAHFHDNRLDLWAGTQYPTNARLIGAELLGLSIDKVNVHTTYMGCGFGRRLETDFIETAVLAAKAMEGTPVKVIWSREEDMTHDVYRPTPTARFRAQVLNHQPVSLDLKLSSLSLLRSFGSRGKTKAGKNTPDKFIVAGAWEQPYEIPNYRVTGYRASNLLPAGWLRSVGESQNSFFHESVMDEVAYAAGQDPMAFRLKSIRHSPSQQVLKKVAELSGWGGSLAEGYGRGLAYVLSSDAATAQVTVVQSTEAGILIIEVFAVVDVGIALDPHNIDSQVRSGVIFGLSAAISGEITVTDGKVDQQNFHQYAPLRIDQIPPITVAVIQSGEDIFGVGESGTPAAAPALGNAIFAATGKRIRSLPFKRQVRFVYS